MFEVSVDAVLRGERSLTADEITDLLEVMTDALDERVDTAVFDPSVSSSGRGTSVAITITVAVDSTNEMDALAKAARFVSEALAAAGLGTGTGLVPPFRHLREGTPVPAVTGVTMQVLQPA